MNDISKQINAARKTMNIYLLLGILFLAVWLVLLCLHTRLNIGVPLTFIPLLAAIFLFIKMFSHRKVLGSLVKVFVVNEILAETFELESYLPKGFFPKEQINETGLMSGYMTGSYEYRGSDLIKGKYRGVPIEFCDITLLDKRAEGGHTTLFKGQWLEIGLKNPVGSAVYLAENTGENAVRNSVKLQKVNTDNDAFNKKYRILAENPRTAFYVLTPDFIEYIISADDTANADTYFCFLGDRVRIAMDSERDLFELDKLKKSLNVDKVRAKFNSDLRYITGIIDELLKNEFLFGGS